MFDHRIIVEQRAKQHGVNKDYLQRLVLEVRPRNAIEAHKAIDLILVEAYEHEYDELYRDQQPEIDDLALFGLMAGP